MRAFYEAFWQDAPQDPEPWEWERRRALLLEDVRPGERVLDLGCGAGRFLVAIQEAGAEPVGVELAEAAAERARANTGADVRLVETDGSLPLGHGEIDLVWCSEVLEHIPDVAYTLAEVRRVLKPQGRLLATVPYHGRVQAAGIALTRFDDHFDPLGQHVRFFTRRSLARALDAAGFVSVTVKPAGRQLLIARAQRPGPVEEFRYACCRASAAPRATHDAHVPEARITIACGPRHPRLRHIRRTDHSSTDP